jgi:hypothetical protein
LGVCFEGIGYLVFPLAVFGVVRSRAYRIQDPRFVLVALFVLQLLVIPLLHSHVRFVSGYGVLLLPFAGAAFLELSLELCRGRGRTMLVAGLLLVTLPDLLRLPKAVNAQRLVVRELGEWLAPRLSHDDMLVTEMARLQYFAGVKPGPPRRLRREEILASCGKRVARFCVVVPARTGVGDKQLTALGFRPMALPPRIARMAKQRRMLVYERLPR